MAVATVANFVQTLNSLPLLTPEQKAQLPALQQQFPDLKALAQELIKRGWLTLFQANQIAKGKGQELVLDQYIVLDLLGQGGMGAVFKARQSRMKRLVALKVIKREALASPTAVERFKRETEATAKLSHPNIVTVFDTNLVNGVHFLVMEYIEGTDLSKLVKREGPLPVDRACDYVRQAALGLQHAHEQGLVHRDIKPANLMLTKQGVVKVMDMGLARSTGEMTGLTATGAVMGTPDFIAPEQALNAKGVDIRADIYSLGCTLYFLLTGRPPFTGESMTEVLLKHQLHEPEPVEKVRPGLPPGLVAVVKRMMAKKPEQRFQTPGQVAKVLGEFASSVARTTDSNSVGQQLPVSEQDTVGDQPRQPPSATLAEPHVGSILTTGRRHWRLVVLGAGALGLVSLLVVVAIVGWPANSTPAQMKMPPKEITNSIGMKFSRIPAGVFLMGSPKDEPGRSEGPEGGETQHQVEISQAFYMGVFPITQDEYEQVTGNNPSWFSKNGQGKEIVKGLDTRRFPVESVAYQDATDFCLRLSQREDEKRAHRRYRLPTEAEWEYACRAAATSYSIYHFGNAISPGDANIDNSLGRTTAVGSYKPNALGLYDMHGPVLQWCQDWLGPYPKEPQKDPTGPPNGR